MPEVHGESGGLDQLLWMVPVHMDDGGSHLLGQIRAVAGGPAPLPGRGESNLNTAVLLSAL